MSKPIPMPRRMQPADRESAILKCAANIVANEGVSAVTMDRIAKDSGVSRSLIYTYFANATLLLQELYLRETEALRKQQREEATQLEDFADYVRCLTLLFLQHVKDKGDFMTKLMHEPSITEVLLSNFSQARRDSGMAIARRISKLHDVPLSVSIRIADVGMGISARAGDQIQRFNLPVAEATELTVAMILGAVQGAVQAWRRGDLNLPDVDEATNA
jgi:AcrR family transcriptional regulator